jgi:alkylation response protein AidB-like acyl-CoA dehydrogenase
VALEEISRASASVGLSYGAHSNLCVNQIHNNGSEEQKRKYLPKLVSGEHVGALAMSEPNAGSDVVSMKLTAKDAGDHYVLNGNKMWITNGPDANVYVIYAKTDPGAGPRGITAFIVERDAPGFTHAQKLDKLGMRGSNTCELVFQDCKVPKENILGEIGNGHKIAFNILNIGRFKLCAMVAGGARNNATVAIQYANEREQFGQPISQFGAIKHKMAEQAAKIFAVETATYRVSDLIDKRIKELQEDGKKYEEALMGAAEEYAIECAMLKVFGSEVLDYVVDETVQIHGGYGYSEEYKAARAYRDSRINRIFEGTNEINRLLTVDMLIKRAMKGSIDVMGPAKKVQEELMEVPDFNAEEPEGLLAKELETVGKAKKAILMIAGKAVQDMMQELEHEQEIIMDVTDMLIEVFACESAILRTQKIADTKGEEAAEPYVDLTKVYVSDALERINLSGKYAIQAFNQGDDLKMMMLGLKRFTKMDPVNTKELRRKIADRLVEANAYCF